MATRIKPLAPVTGNLAEATTGPGYEALRFLSRHELEHTPVNFALAWQYRMEPRSLLAMAVDSILMEGRNLTPADVQAITAAQLSRPRGGDTATESSQDLLRHQTLRLADIAAGAASQSSDFGRDLSSGLFKLSGGSDGVQQIVQAMVHRTQGIQGQLAAASREIEDLRQQVEISRDDAHRDALTGLLNRRGARHALAARRSSRNGAVALCDVDHFKSVNDRFGHGVGDRVLKAVGECLVESLPGDTVARWGGEEFLLVLDDIDLEGAVQRLEHARRNLAARSFRIRQGNAPIGTVTVSIGVATLKGMEQDDAVEAADQMLYEAKRSGRNRVAADAARSS